MRILSKIIIVTICSALILPNFVFGEDLAERCKISNIENECNQMDAKECRSLLEKCEKYYQQESQRIQGDINKTAQEKTTLENKIYGLNQTIKSLDYQIYQSNLVIKDLGIQIIDTSSSIEKTSIDIEESKIQLAGILRALYEEDQKTTVELFLGEEDISDFFDDLVALEILNSRNKDLLQDIKLSKENLINEKDALDKEEGSLTQAVKMHELQKGENQSVKQQQQYYLNITEQEYQQQIIKKQNIEQKASEIRARIFELAGVTKAPTFGEAYEIAKYVEGITGIRPAFLLAVLQQESAIGKNVGQCYLPKNSNENQIRRIMAAPPGSRRDDVSYFKIITAELGLDPYTTPVSCPMSVGWGGAMGPAQFIPTTWISYRARLQGILGRPASPWNIRDAFLASALYLTDYGAKSRTQNGEWKAAMIYFSGSTTNSAFYWYADQVLAKAAQFEEDIKTLEAAK